MTLLCCLSKYKHIKKFFCFLQFPKLTCTLFIPLQMEGHIEHTGIPCSTVYRFK